MSPEPENQNDDATIWHSAIAPNQNDFRRCNDLVHPCVPRSLSTNARVTAFGPAPPEIIDHYGTADSTNYGEVRIEMDWSDEDKSELVERGVREDLLAVIDTPTELRVVCSATDVIYHDFPGMQLD